MYVNTHSRDTVNSSALNATTKINTNSTNDNFYFETQITNFLTGRFFVLRAKFPPSNCRPRGGANPLAPLPVATEPVTLLSHKIRAMLRICQ